MKRPRFSPLAAGAALACFALTADPAPAQEGGVSYSPILGYYKFEVPVGSSAWVCGLVKPKDHQGLTASWAAGGGNTTFTIDDRDLSSETWDNHYVEILEVGAWQGLVLDILSTTGNSITVLGDLSVFGFDPGTLPEVAFAVREHVTLGELFPEGKGMVEFQDSVTLFYPDATSATFLFGDLFGTGTKTWLRPDFSSADDEIIYPGQGFLISAAQATTLLVGENEINYVKDTPTVIPLYQGGAINLVGLVNPLVATNVADPIFPSEHRLDELGILETFEVFSDSVTVYENTGSLAEVGTFLVSNLTGGEYFSTDGFNNFNSLPVPVGQAINLTPSTSSVEGGTILYYQQPVLH